MKKRNLFAFTIVELIVTITILAILGTIGFLSFKGYSKDARNSNRITDMKLIVKSMSLFEQAEGVYPIPDTPTSLTYSGGVAWTQGHFGTGVLGRIGRMSNLPVDPLTGALYAYSILANGKKYQIGGALEEGLFTYTPSLSSQAYAVSNNELVGYTMGDYISQEVVVKNGDFCFTITTPSILLSEMPVGSTLIDGELYSYSYSRSQNLPLSYTEYVEDNTPGTLFETKEIFSECSIENLGELELYIAELSTAYQSLAGIERYDTLIFQPTTKSYLTETAINLESLGITIHPAIMEELKAPPPIQYFGDSFTGGDGNFLIGGHSPDTGSGVWTMIAGGNSTAYTINTNKLLKNTIAPTYIFPNIFPDALSTNYTLGFTAENFSSGYIEMYLRYIDVDNYYKARISPSGYQLSKRLEGVDSIFQDINDPISDGSTVEFSVKGDSLILSINGIEKENIVAGGISAIGDIVLFLQNSGAMIDDYILTYQ